MQKTWVRILSTGMTIAMMAVIFFFSTEPAVKSDSTSGIIAERIADMTRPDWRTMQPEERKAFFDQIHYAVRKAAHFTEFAMLGFSLRICLESWLGGREKGKSGLGFPSWLGATIYAALDEMHQRLVDGRTGRWQDVMIDSSGVLTGVLLACLLIRLIYRRERRSGSEILPPQP